MTREEVVLNYLREHDIPFENYNHPEGKTIEEAKEIIKTFIEMIKREITDESELEKLEDATC